MIAAAERHARYRCPLRTLAAAFRTARAVAEDPTAQPPAANLTLAKSALLLASLLPDENDVAAVARVGLAAARRAGADDADPAASYYAGALLGLIMRGQGLRAIGRLPELAKMLKTAAHEPGTDSGGPLRVLGMLYLRAPPWPTGIGDLDLALEYLARAASDFPGHPANHLYYAYALREDGAMAEARKSLDAAVSLIVAGDWGDFGLLWQKEAAELRKVLQHDKVGVVGSGLNYKLWLRTAARRRS